MEENSIDSEGTRYQVFLSFRGPDTCHGFVSVLFEYLKDAGVRVLMDDEELRVGENIGLMRAIDDSKIYVPIFSRTYASSKWCLDEVAKMVEATKRSNSAREIIPIFYDVSTDEVKREDGLYDKALTKHGADRQRVERWKDALKEVCKVKGRELKNEEHAKFCKSIVSEILIKLKAQRFQETKCQVFLSFRGDDTRQGFTSILFEYLYDAGVRVFMDENELRAGENIGNILMQAIDDSKIYIPILSKNYASSKWCLRELSKMVEATERSESTKKIIPIFYHVSRYEVRSKGLDDQALTALGEDPQTVQQWKDALTKVSHYLAFNVEQRQK